MTDRYVYTPYGVEAPLNTSGNPFRYTGRRYDPESELYYYRARYYWPEIGRFLETDPIGYADQMNLYAYVANNPLNATDPTGNETVFVGGAGDSGAYKDDFVRALSEAGIQNVRGSDPSVTTGWFLFDAALGVMNFNDDMGRTRSQAVDIQLASPSLFRQTSDEQYNLVGYSWGSAIVAQHAVYEVSEGKHVDNLVLIGAPLNQSLRSELEGLVASGGIGRIIEIDLGHEGDPVHFGMSDGEIIWHTPRLAWQMPQNIGHFYYSGTDDQGAARRDELARRLRDEGLE